MKCPSCQFEQSDERPDCECCGLIFSKWKQRHEPPPPEVEPMGGGPESPAENREEVPALPLAAGSFPLAGERFYHRLASVEFQRDPSAGLVYYPWGGFGRGYQGMDQETGNRIHRFETHFSCVHCPALVLLWMVALLLWLYSPSADFRGCVVFAAYLLASYGWFGWRSRQWTSGLTPCRRPYDQKQYAKSFARVFYWKAWVSPEVLSLFMLSAGLWLWLSSRFPFYFSHGFLVQWVWLLLSSSVLVGSSYFYYFKRQ